MSYEAIAMLGNWGLTKKSEDWIERASHTFWNVTCTVNKKSMDELLSATLKNISLNLPQVKLFHSLKAFSNI